MSLFVTSLLCKDLIESIHTGRFITYEDNFPSASNKEVKVDGLTNS